MRMWRNTPVIIKVTAFIIFLEKREKRNKIREREREKEKEKEKRGIR